MAATTVEATGKRWKTAKAVGVAGLLASLVVMLAAPTAGAVLGALSVLVAIGASVGAWWYHG